jgi:hypothetical protein
MLTVTSLIKKGNRKEKVTLSIPESWNEISVEQYQRIVKEWDGYDWIKLFSILSGLEVNDISTSTDGKLETTLYRCIQFVFEKSELENIPMPKKLELRTIWFKDSPLVYDSVTIPENLGRLSIGQAIQARKLLEESKDIRECISSVTAIYLQPLIDKGPFDMLRAIEIEQVILKMYISKIYPIGFFFLNQLSESGRKHESVWSRIRSWVRRRNEET